MLVLSLFPGIGLLDMAFELEGFTVVRGPDVLWGGDIRRFHPPPRVFQGIIGGPPCQMFSSLARLVIANGHNPRFGNLIPEFERCVIEAQPDWFVMENVPAAPEPKITGYGMKPFLLDNSHLAGDDGFGQEQRRLRKFCFGMRGRANEDVPSLLRYIDLATFLLPDPERYNAVIGTADQRHGHETLVGGGGAGPAARQRARAVSSSLGGRGAGRPNDAIAGASNNGKGRYRLPDACRLQGLPEDFLADAPFTAEGKLKAVANGVPLPMGSAIARAVREAIGGQP